MTKGEPRGAEYVEHSGVQTGCFGPVKQNSRLTAVLCDLRMLS